MSNLFDSSFRLLNLVGQIESVQYQAALAVTGTWKGTSTNRIYEELGWESLSDRRWFPRLIQFFKIQNGLLLNILKPLFLFSVIIFLVPEVKMTWIVFILILFKYGMKSAPPSDKHRL